MEIIDWKTESKRLAKELGNAQKQLGLSLSTSLERAAECGEIMLRAKELAPHGQFKSWVRDNFGGSYRTATDYMRVAQHLPAISKVQNSALLSVDSVLRNLKEDRKFAEQNTPPEGAENSARNEPEETPKISGGTTFDIDEIEGATPSATDSKSDAAQDAPSSIVDAEPSAEEIMSGWNADVESFCRQLVKFFTDACPSGAWVDESRKTIALDQVKSAASTVRLAKGKAVCPLCDGEGCDRCRNSGFMPAQQLSMV